MATTLNFTLDGVAGDLKIIYTPFKFRFYQGGIELKKSSTFKPVYSVQTTDGGSETVKILNNAIKGYMVEYRGQRSLLEEKLTSMEIMLCFMPIVFMILGCVFIVFITGVIGGALLGGFAGGSFVINSTFMRQERPHGFQRQLIMSFIVSVSTYAAYALIGTLFVMLLRGTVYSFL